MDKQKVLTRLFSDLQTFLQVLDGENLSYIAQAQKKSISELLSKLQENKDAPVEDAEYMIMNCPSGSPGNDVRENSRGNPDPNVCTALEWRGRASACPAIPPQPPYNSMDEEDTYEEAEPFIPASQSIDKLDSDSSHYESYGEEEEEEGEGEEEDFVKDRAHYIRGSSSQPCLRPVPESRICEYLWRKKWLGQWSRQLFIIKHDSLLCFKCAKDLQPVLELRLRGCQVIYKSKHNKKMQHELKVVSGSDTLILGFHSCSQVEEWRKIIEELSVSSYGELESRGSLCVSRSDRLDSFRSSSMSHTDSEEERRCVTPSAPNSTDGQNHAQRAAYLNVLMGYQWQTLWCQVEAGVLNLFRDAGCEESPQYTIQLRGSEIRPDTSHTHTHRITIVQHGDPVAVLEASCSEDKEQWVQLLRDGSSTTVDLPYHHASRESLSCLKSRTLPTANTYMDDPFQQLSGSVHSSPIYCNTASLEHMFQKSHTGVNGDSSRSANYSNCEIFSPASKVCEVERGVQKLQLAGKRVQMRAGSEMNLLNVGSKPVKRPSFRQSLLPFCTDRAQGGFLTPLLRRTASAKLTLRRSPSSLLIEHGRVFHRKKEWEMKTST